jgi:predicted DNA binding CopG/RHH family protein
MVETLKEMRKEAAKVQQAMLKASCEMNKEFDMAFLYGLVIRFAHEPSALDTGAKERRSMSAKIKYTDELLGKVQIVTDFLPLPTELAFREEGVKVTLALSKKSIDFFKSDATKHQTQYQRMIRRLLDAYVDGQSSRL